MSRGPTPADGAGTDGGAPEHGPSGPELSRPTEPHGGPGASDDAVGREGSSRGQLPPDRGGRSLAEAGRQEDPREPEEPRQAKGSRRSEAPRQAKGSRRSKGSRSSGTPRSGTARDVLRTITPRARIDVSGGTTLSVLVLSCHPEDTTGVDLASGTLVRARVAWPEEHGPDLAPFDVVAAVLSEEPERDDLAQPEAVTVDGLPRHLGTLHGRQVRRLLRPLAAPVEEHILGFPGASAPYWEFRGFRPSLALVVPTTGPVLFRRDGDRAVWIRFGWGRSDNWLPVEDPRAERALDAARRDRLSGKDLSSALGFKPHYLVASVSTPRDGHCYKTVRAVLPKG